MSNKIAFQSHSSTWIKKIKPLNQQMQNDKRNYRFLCTLLQNNSHTFCKQHKACLGDIQIPQKIIILQQQSNSVKNALDQYQKYSQKLIKSMFLRNGLALKQQNLYFDVYKNSFQGAVHTDLNQCERQSPNCQNQKSSYFTDAKNQEKFKSRPMSANFQITKNIGNQINKNVTKKRLFNSYHGVNQQFRQQKRRCSIAVSNFHYIDKKTTIQSIQQVQYKNKQHSQNMDTDQMWKQIGEDGQVFIRRKNIQNCHKQTFSIKKMRPLSNSCYTNGIKTPFKNGFNKEKQRILMQFSQKQKIQKKILMINSVLAYNLTRSQGYQPKSKLKAGTLF